MRVQNNVLVEEALSISQELIRVAILWPEMWHEGLEEASRLYFTERDPEGMIAVLEPLHSQLEKASIDTHLTPVLKLTYMSKRVQIQLVKGHSCKPSENNWLKLESIHAPTKPMVTYEI